MLLLGIGDEAWRFAIRGEVKRVSIRRFDQTSRYTSRRTHHQIPAHGIREAKQCRHINRHKLAGFADFHASTATKINPHRFQHRRARAVTCLNRTFKDIFCGKVALGE